MKTFIATFTFAMACTMFAMQSLDQEHIPGRFTSSETTKNDDKKEDTPVYAPYKMTPAAEAFAAQADTLYNSAIFNEQQYQRQAQANQELLRQQRNERGNLRAAGDDKVHYPANPHDTSILGLMGDEARIRMARAHNLDMANMQMMAICWMLMANGSPVEEQQAALQKWMQLNALRTTETNSLFNLGITPSTATSLTASTNTLLTTTTDNTRQILLQRPQYGTIPTSGTMVSGAGRLRGTTRPDAVRGLQAQ